MSNDLTKDSTPQLSKTNPELRDLKNIAHFFLLSLILLLWYFPLISRTFSEALSIMVGLHATVFIELMGGGTPAPKAEQFPMLTLLVEASFFTFLCFVLTQRSWILTGSVLIAAFCWSILNVWVLISVHGFIM